MSATEHAITPEVGKRYVTRGGGVTPPYEHDGIIYNHDGMWRVNGGDDPFEIIAEYVEPVVADTYRRDLEAKLYVAMVNNSSEYGSRYEFIASCAIDAADTLIEAQEEAK